MPQTCSVFAGQIPYGRRYVDETLQEAYLWLKPRRPRASAAALSTVLTTTMLSYGNMRFSGSCPAETP
jgi:hypothetical protein